MFPSRRFRFGDVSVFALAGLLCVALCGGATSQEKGKTPTCLDLVPADGFMFIQVRFPEMLESKWTALLPAELQRNLRSSPLPIKVGMLDELVIVSRSPLGFGFGGARMETKQPKTAVAPEKTEAKEAPAKKADPCGDKPNGVEPKEDDHDNVDHSPLLLFRAAEKIDIDKAGLIESKKNGPFGGKIYEARFGAVLLLPDGKTGAFGHTPASVLSVAKGKGKLGAVARSLQGKNHTLALGLAISDAARKELKQDLADPFHFGPEQFLMRLMLPLVETQTASATVALGKTIEVDVRGELTDATAAKNAKHALEDLLVLLRVMGVTSLEMELERERDRAFTDEKELEIAHLEVFLDAVRIALRNAKVAQKGNMVTASASLGLKVDEVVAKAKSLVKTRADDPTVKAIRLRALNTDNLKQIALAMHGFHDTMKALPPQAICDKKTGKPLLSWRVAILPYVEQQELFFRFKLDEPWDSAHNIKLLDQIPPVYSPIGFQTKEKGHTYYQVFKGPGAVFELTPNPTSRFGAIGQRLVTIPDGTANTLMVAESGKSVPWTKPEDIEFTGKEKAPVPPLGAASKEGFLAAFGDGSVQFIRFPLDGTLFYRLVHRADGNPISDLRK